MHCFKLLILNGARGYVTTWPPPSAPEAAKAASFATNLITPANLQRLRNLPIYFFTGSQNGVFSPESTDISYTNLRNAWDEGQYERDVIDGFGHSDCWMGEKAAEAVWPRVRAHMKKVSRLGGAASRHPV